MYLEATMEKTTDIFSYFIETEDLRNDPRILCFIAYGSCVYNTSNEQSDVDILLVIRGNKSYRAAKLVDGKHLDIHALTLDEIKNHIIYERASGNQYIVSVLLNGKVLINREQTYEFLKDFLLAESNKIRFKRSINLECASLAVERCEDFLDSDLNDNYTYYTALELLRKVICVKLGVSDIIDYKVYKLYTHPEYAKEKYVVKLPNQSFIDLYLEALTSNNIQERKNNLVKFLTYLIGVNIQNHTFTHQDYADDNHIKRLLVSASHLVISAEDNLIKNTPCSDSLYYLALERINSIVKMVYRNENRDNFNSLFDQAILITDTDERIKALEELFFIASKKYNLDYDDFVLAL